MYKERKAKIKYHSAAFLNPQAMFLRDLSVAYIQSFAKKGTKILDPTAATGIRGIRFYLETKSKNIVFLDIDKAAVNVIRKNMRFNKVKGRVIGKSIQEFANSTNERFTVIDLDPFGSAAPYIYDLMKIAKDRKVSRNQVRLLVTATDTAVLCGAHERACVKAYDAKPMHNELCQEVGIRILLGFIARIAAQFNSGIDVLFSLPYLHYMKVFVKLKYGADNSTESMKNLGYAYYCSKCGYRNIEKSFFPRRTKCEICGNRLTIAGKLWAGSIQDKHVVKTMLDYLIKNKMDKSEVKTLDTIYHEPDIPLYYSVPKMTKRLAITAVSPNYVVEKLRAKGYIAARASFEDSSIKTNATVSVINRILKQKR